MIKLTFLGTGTSQGVPMIACPCEVCASGDPRDKRLRTSVLVQVGVCGVGNNDGEIPNLGHDGGDDPTGSEISNPDSGDDPHDPTGSERSVDETVNIVIDAGPDFRTQMLAAGVRHLDAILLTHEHKDHTGGIDDVRAFNYFGQAPLDIYATEQVQNAVRRDYAYAFEEHPYPGAPEIALHTIADEPFLVPKRRKPADPTTGKHTSDDSGAAPSPSPSPSPAAIEVIPIHGLHYKLPVTGFRIGGNGASDSVDSRSGDSGSRNSALGSGSRNGNSRAGGLAYLTDFNHIEDSEILKLQGLDVLVINALGHFPHLSHFNLEQAVEVARRVGARRTYLTHMSHRMGLYAAVEPTLPPGIHLAYDNLVVEI